MFELIVSNRGQSYCVFGETLNKADYPTIEIGSTVFVPSLDKMLLVLDAETFVDVKTGAIIETEIPKEEAPVEPAPEEIPDDAGDEPIEDPVVEEETKEPAEATEE